MKFEEMNNSDGGYVPSTYTRMERETASTDVQVLEPKQISINLLQNNLGNCLGIIENEVMKGYVTRLEELQVVASDDRLFAGLNDIHFFRISELVYQEEEFAVDKFAMVYHAFSNKPCTLVLMLKSDGEKVNFYLGARPNDKRSSGTMFQMLKHSLLGFFPGSRISDYYDEDMERDMQNLDVGSVSSVTCVADYKQKQEQLSNKNFIQGLEKYVDAMKGNAYTAVFIADNLSYNDLMDRKREYEQIYTQISPFSNMQINFTVSDGKSGSTGSSYGKTFNKSTSKTYGTSENQSTVNTSTDGTSESVGRADTTTHTDSKSKAEGKSHTDGSSDGTSRSTSNTVGETVSVAPMGVGVSASYSHTVTKGTSHTESVSDTVSKTLTHGFSDSVGKTDSRTYGTSASTSVSNGRGSAINKSDTTTFGESFGLTNTLTVTDTFGSSRGISLNAQNMTLNLTMQKLQRHLERIEECESYGMWNFAAYFLGETAAETETAANTYKAVMVGTDSGIERSAVNSWNDPEQVKGILPYITHFTHPQFEYEGFSYDENRRIAVNPSVLVSTNELAIHMGLPRHSVNGLPIVEHAAFANEVVSVGKYDEKKAINLGKIYNFGEKTNTDVDINLDSLTMHTFITGSTGAGKSNAVYNLLNRVKIKGIPFLVIEPAKGEYKNVFKDVRCYGTNPLMGEMLRINPFSFPNGIHVLEHIDRIVEIFNVCWPMYSAMPAVLKESIEQAYKSAGWDLEISENIRIEGLFPTFDDVLCELNRTIKSSDYSADTKGDYIGSLSTRLSSLTNGINGSIFVSDEMSLSDLFESNAIVDISRIGSTETKALIMGLVVMKLQEYRASNAEGMNLPLRHITVLEEAHNLLRKTSVEQQADSSNLVGKSVEMLTNAIAEMRTFGEGFVIVDQAPDLLDTAVIRNTNTKIILRLPESRDREITGRSISLKEQQYMELSKLPTGVAAVYQNDWQEAVLCQLPKFEQFDITFMNKKRIGSTIQKSKKERDALLHVLLDRTNLVSFEKMRSMVMKSNVSAKVKKDLILNWNNKNLIYEWAVADYIGKNYDLSDVFRGTSSGLKNLEQLYQTMRQNLNLEFSEFDEQEMMSIIYYVCRLEHEKHPENNEIEQLRIEFLREKVI